MAVSADSPVLTKPEPRGADAPLVRFAGVAKTYDGKANAVEGVELEVARGEFLTLLGPSGSGKTTCLMMLAGFESATAGEIYLDGQPIGRTPPHKRGIGMVFQNYALFPHMTVAQNLAFPLQARRMGRAEIDAKVKRALAMVRLDGFGDRRPAQLSGGQQQRVAVARALVFEPALVLMDEPLGALDKSLREQMQFEIKRIHRELGVTIVYVTHDQGEALTMSDRIAVFSRGRIEQVAPPRPLYDQPANLFVATFVGENNALPGRVREAQGGLATIDFAGGALNARAAGPLAGEAVVCVRPENVTIGAAVGANRIDAIVRDASFMGDHVRVAAEAPGGVELVARVGRAESAAVQPGARIVMGFTASAATAFAPRADAMPG